MTYEKFIDQKTTAALHTDSIQLDADSLNPKLYRFQRDIVRWALAKGRAAIFADCGLGKTPMQLEWAYRVSKERGGMVLILAPLAVAAQTVSEGIKFGIEVTLCESASDLRPGINITNYQAVLMGRRGLGIELKDSYFVQARANMEQADSNYKENGANTDVRMRCPKCGIKMTENFCPICGYGLGTDGKDG